jgi:predicted site-specific integrase-resolvase
MTEVVGLVESITGFKPSRATIWRWQLNGRLVARRIGGRLYTTEQDVRHMLKRDEQRKGISDEIESLRRERDEARREVCQLLAQAPGSRASETYAEERGWQYLNARDAGK